ncbi:hypothetical protein [Roseospirillum parvum]|uniref:Uncharacterized protein n=1 Tax=Roseospirillum parvum TaxID=83401 RepID=A0A1G7ZRZ0_9PROT|nr:hypothetical protein [Roseospirillum parvum]SDH11387.1 hypothetical protein SAMN05421742_104198 [Roseospirillum parvum]
MAERAPSDVREKRVPRLREQAQGAYELLVALLSRAGSQGMAADIAALPTVNDVMAQRPEMVGSLLELAWGLRTNKAFEPFFLSAETGQVVETKSQPLAPCGRTFHQIEIAHLQGAARLYFERCEIAWAERRARQARQRHAKDRAKAKGSLGGRLRTGMKELLGGQPEFDPQEFRAQYPGHGLYQQLKPHLKRPSQFKFITEYARLSRGQAERLGPLITALEDQAAVERLAQLKPEDISQLMGIARAHAAVLLKLDNRVTKQRASAKPGARPQKQAPELTEEEARVLESKAGEVFVDLILHHMNALDGLRNAGTQAPTLVRRLTPIFGSRTWSLFADAKSLQNVIDTPDHLRKVLGPLMASFTPGMSRIFEQINDPEIAKDILVAAREHIPDPELVKLFNDPGLEPIWSSLPAKFNNNYRYQRDAPADSGLLRNYDNLSMVCKGIFESLRRGGDP